MAKAPNISARQKRADARRQLAREQFEVTDQIRNDRDGRSISAICREAGFPNSTITQRRRLGLPVKAETFLQFVDAGIRLMSNKGLEIPENVLRFGSRYGPGDNIPMTDPTPKRLELAIGTANEDFNLGLSDDDIRLVSGHIAELYEIIVIEEDKLGGPIPNDENGRAVLRRAISSRRQIARRANQI